MNENERAFMEAVKNGKSVTVTERGVIANGISNPGEVLAVLIDAVTEIYNKEVGPINMKRAATEIVHALEAEENRTFVRLLIKAMGEDDVDDDE